MDNKREVWAAYNEAVRELNKVADEIDKLPDNCTDELITELERKFADVKIEVERTKANAERHELITEARANSPRLGFPDARGSLTVESVYRPDTRQSFFADLVNSTRSPEAMERLRRHQEEVTDQLGVEKRDVTSADPGGAGFIPPIYLGDQWAELPRPDRPFADVVPTLPLPDTGLQIQIPKVQAGTTVASQTAENQAVSETDIDTQSVTANMVTIAGQNDISRQALERSFPGLDMVIYADLLAAYDAQLDSQLLSGIGSAGQHLGIRGISSPNTVTYTDGSPTGAELLPKLYDAIQKVASTRFRNPDVIVMHPTRGAWLASQLSSSFPLFQQGSLIQSIGQQAGGFSTSFGGLQVILDANVGTTYGAGTNEDEIYVLNDDDLLLFEGPVRRATYEDVGSGTLTVRLQLFAYSFFVPNRQVKSLCIVSGSGLSAPTFP